PTRRPDRERLTEAIAKCVPAPGEDVRKCLFELARRIKGLDPDADEVRRRGYVELWEKACEEEEARREEQYERGVQGEVSRAGGGGRVELDVYAVFELKWPTIRVPTGTRWAAVVEHSRAV